MCVLVDITVVIVYMCHDVSVEARGQLWAFILTFHLSEIESLVAAVNARLPGESSPLTSLHTIGAWAYRDAL